MQELKGTVAQQHKQIEALTATVQKVSDQLELTKAAPQLVTTLSSTVFIRHRYELIGRGAIAAP